MEFSVPLTKSGRKKCLAVDVRCIDAAIVTVNSIQKYFGIIAYVDKSYVLHLELRDVERVEMHKAFAFGNPVLAFSMNINPGLNPTQSDSCCVSGDVHFALQCTNVMSSVKS